MLLKKSSFKLLKFYFLFIYVAILALFIFIRKQLIFSELLIYEEFFNIFYILYILSVPILLFHAYKLIQLKYVENENINFEINKIVVIPLFLMFIIFAVIVIKKFNPKFEIRKTDFRKVATKKVNSSNIFKTEIFEFKLMNDIEKVELSDKFSMFSKLNIVKLKGINDKLFLANSKSSILYKTKYFIIKKLKINNIISYFEIDKNGSYLFKEVNLKKVNNFIRYRKVFLIFIVLLFPFLFIFMSYISFLTIKKSNMLNLKVYEG
jgi:hypothetical protein